MSWQNWVNALLGLWLIVATYLYVPSGAGRTVMVITGVVVAIIGFWGGLAQPADRHQMQH